MSAVLVTPLVELPARHRWGQGVGALRPGAVAHVYKEDGLALTPLCGYAPKSDIQLAFAQPGRCCAFCQRKLNA